MSSFQLGLGVACIVIGVVFNRMRSAPKKVVVREEEKRPLWISVEGIIGAGKSTFIDRIVPLLENHFGEGSVLVVPEPVDVWLASGHLEKATQEPYVAQTFFFHTRIIGMLSRLNTPRGKRARIIISERSPISDRHVFWKTTCEHTQGVTELAKDTYPLLWETWVTLLGGLTPSLFLYLKLDVDTSQQRMRARNRECEQDTVTATYQHQLEAAHEELFGKDFVYLFRHPVPCVQMSSREDFKSSREVAATLAERLIAHIEELK